MKKEILPVFVSFATIPLVIGLLASNGLLKLLRQMGQESEELLRAERLPNLEFPDPPGHWADFNSDFNN
jgi:hypothetical protein